jgi:hypothetical protein
MPPFYIGSSSLERIGNGYKGSVGSIRYKDTWTRELKENPNLFEIKIISLCSSRKEAFDKELKYQLQLKVKNNPMYINLGYAQPNGAFYPYSGKEHWSKQPGKIHNAISNHPRGMLGKKHTKERNEYMSRIQMGEKNHFFW